MFHLRLAPKALPDSHNPLLQGFVQAERFFSRSDRSVLERDYLGGEAGGVPAVLDRARMKKICPLDMVHIDPFFSEAWDVSSRSTIVVNGKPKNGV